MQRLPVFWSSCSFPASLNSVRDLKAIQEEIVVSLLDHCLSSRALWAGWETRFQEVGFCGFLAGPDDFAELAYVTGFSCGVHEGDVCGDDSVDDDDGDAYEGCGVNDEYNVWLGCGNDGGDDEGDDDVGVCICHAGEGDGEDDLWDGDDDDDNDDGDDGKFFGAALSLD